MEWQIMLRGETVGKIEGERQGSRIGLAAACPFAEGWIYRLYLGTEDAPRGLYLGVMLPEGKRFVLRKKVSLRELESLGAAEGLRGCIICHRPGEPEPPEAEPKPEEPPMTPLPFPPSAPGPLPQAEHFLHDVFASCGGRFVRWEGVDYWLAPGVPGEALGPAAFFCLLTWVPWKDGGWWVLCTDENGDPYPLPSDPE